MVAYLQAEKNVFVVFYSGERAKSKILKICDAFGANRYPFTDDLGKQFQMITEVRVLITGLSGRYESMYKLQILYLGVGGWREVGFFCFLSFSLSKLEPLFNSNWNAMVPNFGYHLFVYNL